MGQPERTADAPRNLREYLEERARFWRIPFTEETTDFTLVQAVLNAEAPHFYVLGTDNYERVPGCFAFRWAGLGDADCARCKVQVLCLHRFAFKSLPSMVEELPGAPASVVAQQLQTEPYAIPFAQLFARIVEAGVQLPPHQQQKLPAPGRQHSAFSATLLGTAPRPLGVAAQKAAAKIASVRAVPDSGMYVTPQIGNRNQQRPRIEPPPRRHTQTGREVYGIHTFAKRFQRERDRNPKLRLLPVGTTLSRTWTTNGKTIEVTVEVRKDHYLYKGQSYATLYDVARTVTGMSEYTEPHRHTPKRQGAWSGMRFFKMPLARALESERI